MFETEEAQVAHFKVSFIKDDQYIGNNLRHGHEWDGWMRQDLPHMIKPGTEILDVGGNIGYNALMFSDYAPVHTFEPLFHTIISKNVEQNPGVKHPITVCPYGLSDSQARTDIFLPKKDGILRNYGGTSLHPNETQHSDEKFSIQLEKLDDVYTGTPSLMKIDVEGHEFEVIRGAVETINRHRPFLYVEIFGFEESPIPGFLERLGYKQVVQRPEHNYLFIPS
jgi:FkbM family methyltransferase